MYLNFTQSTWVFLKSFLKKLLKIVHIRYKREKALSIRIAKEIEEMKMSKISTAAITVLTTYFGINEIAAKEAEASQNQFKSFVSKGYRVKLATSTTLRDMIFVTYVMEKEVEEFENTEDKTAYLKEHLLDPAQV